MKSEIAYLPKKRQMPEDKDFSTGFKRWFIINSVLGVIFLVLRHYGTK